MSGEKRPRSRRARTVVEPPPVPPPAPDFIPLKTERLTLRQFTQGDAAELHRLINDWEVTRTLAVVPFPYHRDMADDWIVAADRQLRDGSGYHLAITGQEADKEILVGSVGLRLDRAARTGHLGYWVGRRFWGHGVASEAADRVARWSLANLDIDRIEAAVATDNPASAAVLRRIGFHQTGEGTGHSVARGADHPVWLFTATRDDIFGHAEAGPAEPVDAQAAEPVGKPLLLVVACALIDIEGRILLARRPEGKKMAGLWEFPGGKLNPGETPEVALIRELKEELGIDVSAACLAPFAFASHEYEKFHLLMPLFLCRRWQGTPVGRENQSLAWVRPQKLTDYEMPAADKPLIPLLRDFL